MNYLSLLTSSCRALPRFSEFVSAVLNQIDDLIAVVESLPAAFSLPAAVGLQLSLLGESLGIPRPLNMTDADYQTLIRMKLARWRWDGANDTVDSVVDELDPGGILTDNTDGTVTITPAGELPAPAADLYPIPAGIGTT